MFSKACTYGIRGALYIASRSKAGEFTGVKEVASTLDVPQAFTAKILQTLVKSGIVISVRGPNGGFKLNEEAEKTVLDVVLAIDGADYFVGCALGLSECSSENPCPLHTEFVKIRSSLRDRLASMSLAQARELLEEQHFRISG